MTINYFTYIMESMTMLINLLRLPLMEEKLSFLKEMLTSVFMVLKVVQVSTKLSHRMFYNNYKFFTLYLSNFRLDRTEAIEKATVALSTTMYVIREMEDGIDDCEKSCLACNDEPVHAWDEAVAFFTGSLEGFDGNGKGKLFRAWSEDLCTYFRTCGEDGDLTTGTSKSNHEILIEFFIGQNSIFLGFCNAAEKSKVKIVSWMKVVMVQGALLYAYKTYNEEFSEEVQAIGAVAMAAVVPYINACEPADADIIYDGLSVGSQRRGVGFKEIKEAFERNYDCPEMGILCSQVGGIFDSDKFEYMKDAEPCKDKPVDNIDTFQADTDTSSASQTSCTLFLIFTISRFIFSVLR
uniref:Uncharacterized protein n=1 Tax=Proboscia inermis TaxID=420281 RepID=A0A7S0CKQ9_9STRA|mmetsp:Transcript_5639/g.5882  ORF Transcript_5639/g.5882 Transcript_5639/m.5882 type:complete len:351 (+) Transcript_5639:599-1651(+)